MEVSDVFVVTDEARLGCASGSPRTLPNLPTDQFIPLPVLRVADASVQVLLLVVVYQ